MRKYWEFMGAYSLASWRHEGEKKREKRRGRNGVKIERGREREGGGDVGGRQQSYFLPSAHAPFESLGAFDSVVSHLCTHFFLFFFSLFNNVNNRPINKYISSILFIFHRLSVQTSKKNKNFWNAALLFVYICRVLILFFFFSFQFKCFSWKKYSLK